MIVYHIEHVNVFKRQKNKWELKCIPTGTKARGWVP